MKNYIIETLSVNTYLNFDSRDIPLLMFIIFLSNLCIIRVFESDKVKISISPPFFFFLGFEDAKYYMNV